MVPVEPVCNTAFYFKTRSAAGKIMHLWDFRIFRNFQEDMEQTRKEVLGGAGSSGDAVLFRNPLFRGLWYILMPLL